MTSSKMNKLLLNLISNESLFQDKSSDVCFIGIESLDQMTEKEFYRGHSN